MCILVSGSTKAIVLPLRVPSPSGFTVSTPASITVHLTWPWDFSGNTTTVLPIPLLDLWTCYPTSEGSCYSWDRTQIPSVALEAPHSLALASPTPDSFHLPSAL